MYLKNVSMRKRYVTTIKGLYYYKSATVTLVFVCARRSLLGQFRRTAVPSDLNGGPYTRVAKQRGPFPTFPVSYVFLTKRVAKVQTNQKRRRSAGQHTLMHVSNSMNNSSTKPQNKFEKDLVAFATRVRGFPFQSLVRSFPSHEGLSQC